MARRLALLLALLLAAGCTRVGHPLARAQLGTQVDLVAGNTSRLTAKTKLTGKVKLPEALVTQHAAIVSDNGGAVLSNNSASLVANNGAGLVGKTRYLLATPDAQVPLTHATATLLDGAGKPVPGADGKPLASPLAADGSYAFDGVPTDRNLVVAIALGADLGTARALAAKDRAAGAPVDVDLDSSLLTGYVLGTYVTGASDPQATLDKLPGGVEATARAAAAKALARLPALAPATLADAPITAAVTSLGAQDADFAAQLETIRKVFVTSGIFDHGEGRLATELNLSSITNLATLPSGEVVFLASELDKLWRLGPDGHVRTFVGRGEVDASVEGKPGAEAGLDAITCFSQAADGTFWLLEKNRLTRMTPDGIVHEVWKGFDKGSAVQVAGDGTAWVLLGGDAATLWRVSPDGTRRQLRSYDPATTARYANCWQTATSDGHTLWLGGRNQDDDNAPAWADRVDGETGVPTPLALDSRYAGFALDPHGNLFMLAKTKNKVASELWLRTPEGQERLLTKSFSKPFTLDFDGVLLQPDGHFYVTPGNWYVLRYDADGRRFDRLAGTAYVASGNAHDIPWSYVEGVAPRKNGDLLIADSGFIAIYDRTPDGHLTLWLPGCLGPDMDCGHDGPRSGTTLDNFVGMGFDGQERLYLCDLDEHGGQPKQTRLRRVDTDDRVTTIANMSPDKLAERMAVDAAGNVVLATRDQGADGRFTRRLYRVDASSQQPGLLVDLPPTNDGDEVGLALAADGTVWVSSKKHLWRWSPGGAMTAVLDDDRIVGQTLALDSRGRVYLDGKASIFRCDGPNQPLVQVAGAGTSVLAGPTDDDSFGDIHGLVFDAAGDLHFADTAHDQTKVIPARLLPP